MPRLDAEMAAESFDALAHAAQAVAFLPDAAAAVVFDDEGGACTAGFDIENGSGWRGRGGRCW